MCDFRPSKIDSEAIFHIILYLLSRLPFTIALFYGSSPEFAQLYIPLRGIGRNLKGDPISSLRVKFVPCEVLKLFIVILHPLGCSLVAFQL